MRSNHGAAILEIAVVRQNRAVQCHDGVERDSRANRSVLVTIHRDTGFRAVVEGVCNNGSEIASCKLTNPDVSARATYSKGAGGLPLRQLSHDVENFWDMKPDQ